MPFNPFDRERKSTPGGASRSPQQASTTELASGAQRLLSPSARESIRAPAPCTLSQNAAPTGADQQLVLVTHQFHPLFGRQLPCVGKRSNLQGDRLLLQTDDGAIWPLPPQWTDLVCIDPEVVASNGRALLLVSNLMELASMVEHLCGRLAARSRAECKDNYAANVKEIMPHEGLELVIIAVLSA